MPPGCLLNPTFGLIPMRLYAEAYTEGIKDSKHAQCPPSLQFWRLIRRC